MVESLSGPLTAASSLERKRHIQHFSFTLRVTVNDMMLRSKRDQHKHRNGIFEEVLRKLQEQVTQSTQNIHTSNVHGSLGMGIFPQLNWRYDSLAPTKALSLEAQSGDRTRRISACSFPLKMYLTQLK